jgi:predicted nucleotidyltransferase
MAQVNIMLLVTGLFGSMSGKDQATTDLIDIIVELSVEVKSSRDAMSLIQMVDIRLKTE